MHFDVLWGKPARHWHELGEIMETHGFDKPAELRAALDRRPQTAPGQLVEVRDSRNPERLLGFLPKGMLGPLLKPGGGHPDSFNMAAMPPFTGAASMAFSHQDMDQETVTKVRFDIAFRHSDDGWTKSAVFLTEAPLGVLLWLRKFRLPGEGRDEAEERAHRTHLRF